MQVDYGLEDWSSRQPLCAKFCLLQKLKITDSKLFSLSDSLLRSMCALLRFYLGPSLILEVSTISVVTAVLTLLSLRDAAGLWSRRWVHHLSISVQGLAPQNTEYN